MTAREGRARVPGGEVWYRIVGNGKGIPLLALHGGPGAGSAAFQPLEALGRQRPIVVYDQWGAGRSDQPDDASLWRLERFVAEVDAVRRTLSLDQVHLLGHSWGGMLAIEYMLARPAGVRSLALCGTLASVAEFEREVGKLVEALPSDVVGTLRKHEQAGTTNDAEYFGAVMEFLRRHVCRLDPWPEVLLASNPMETPTYRTMWGFNEFTISGNLRNWDRTPRLGEIRVPTLITCGRCDEATPACAETLHRGIPGSRMHIFEDCSHMTFLEQPEEFGQVIGEFLAEHDD
jgi:proline-specific peptidase